MIDINRVLLLGHLTRDAELKSTPTGQSVCKFGIAVNRRKKAGEQWVDEANFFDVTVWGRQAENIAQYLVKGKQVAIDGELRQDRWEQDGQNRSKVEIVASNVQLLGGGAGSSGGASAGNGSFARPASSSGGSISVPYGGGAAPSDSSFTDDVPF